MVLRFHFFVLLKITIVTLQGKILTANI